MVTSDADGPNVDVKEIKAEWKLIWQRRIEDKVRAESIANRSFSLLVYRVGHMVVAREILEH